MKQSIINKLKVKDFAKESAEQDKTRLFHIFEAIDNLFEFTNELSFKEYKANKAQRAQRAQNITLKTVIQ